MLRPIHAWEMNEIAAQAVRDGTAVLEQGRLKRVPIPGGYGMPNLAIPGAWVTAQKIHEQVSVCSDHLGHDAMIAGMSAGNYSSNLIWKWACIYSETNPHSPEAEEMRQTAGKEIMQEPNAMVRARLLDLFDGWSAVLGKLIDGKESVTGALYACNVEVYDVNMLSVICPSTGRRYIHPVPKNFTSAEEARRWVMCLEPGEILDVET